MASISSATATLTPADYIAPAVTTVVAAVAIAFFASSIPLAAIVGLATLCGHITIVSLKKQLTQEQSSQRETPPPTPSTDSNTYSVASAMAALKGTPSNRTPDDLTKGIQHLQNQIKTLEESLAQAKKAHDSTIADSRYQIQELTKQIEALPKEQEALKAQIRRATQACLRALPASQNPNYPIETLVQKLAEKVTQQSALAASSEGPDLKQFTEMANRLRDEFKRLNDKNNTALSHYSLEEIREFMSQGKLHLTEEEYNSIVVPVRTALPELAPNPYARHRVIDEDNPMNDQCFATLASSKTPRTMALPSSNEEDDPKQVVERCSRLCAKQLGNPPHTTSDLESMLNKLITQLAEVQAARAKEQADDALAKRFDDLNFKKKDFLLEPLQLIEQNRSDLKLTEGDLALIRTIHKEHEALISDLKKIRRHTYPSGNPKLPQRKPNPMSCNILKESDSDDEG